jgi:aryl-alcohol dehydrogenase-like predicted oxidoreductase
MIILNPLEPWPGELVLDAARSHDVSLITRVVDYGGIFHDDVRTGHAFAEYDHRKFRPDGWVQAGAEKLERMRPIAERHGMSMLQLACAWNLAQPAVRCVAPTLIQESGLGGDGAPRPIEDKRAELAAFDRTTMRLSDEELQAIREIGENTGCMALKGASVEHDGPPLPDRWGLGGELEEAAGRWGIDPASDLTQHALTAG